MNIEATLLCQAFFALSIFFQALMHCQNLTLKILYLWKSYIDSSDSEFGRAEAGGLAGEEERREESPSPSESARVGRP